MASLKVSLSRPTSTPWPDATQGENVFTFNLNGVDLTVWNKDYIAQFTLAGGASQTVDFTNITSLLYETGVVFAKTHTIGVQVDLVDPAHTNASVTMKPGASNPLQWFFTSATEGMKFLDGQSMLFSDAPTGVGFTVDGAHKTLTFNNPGTDSIVVTVVVIGG